MDLDFQADTIAQAYGQGVPRENGAAPGAAIHDCCDRVGDCLGATCFVLADTVIGACAWAYDASSRLAERLGPGRIPPEYLDPDGADYDGGGGLRLPRRRPGATDYRRNEGGHASESLLMGGTVDGEGLGFSRVPTGPATPITPRGPDHGFEGDTDTDDSRGVLDD